MPGENKLSKKRRYEVFKTLYSKYSKPMVMKRLGIRTVTYEALACKYIKESMKEGDPQQIFVEKIPFSTDESNYGTKFINLQKFDTIIKEAEPTPLQLAIKTYKHMRKR